MSDNTTQRKALQQLESEPSEERIAYYRSHSWCYGPPFRRLRQSCGTITRFHPKLSRLGLASKYGRFRIHQVDRPAEMRRAWRVKIECARGQRKSRQRHTSLPSTPRLMRQHDRALIDDIMIRWNSSEKFYGNKKPLETKG